MANEGAGFARRFCRRLTVRIRRMTPLKQLLLIAALGAASGQAQPRAITGESVAEFFDAAYVTYLIFGESRGEGERRMMTKPVAWLFCT